MPSSVARRAAAAERTPLRHSSTAFLPEGTAACSSASKLAFTFYARDGRAVSFGAINVDATDSFRSYFATAALGGMFSLKASFPVTGSPDEIDSVEMELVNSQGNTRTERIKF